jgi:iron(III) transport system substrate-binding protein
MYKKKLLALFTACALAAPFVAPAKQSPQDIYMYSGTDREQRLLEGARKEGTLVFYTSLSLKDSAPLTEAFEKKYGIKVSLLRAKSEKLVERAIKEARAGRFTADVFETNGPEMERLHRENLLSQFESPAFKDLPAAAFPSHRHYVASRFNFFVMGYNTNLVRPEDVPKTYQDVLSPRWQGEVGIEAGDVDWFAAVIKGMGEQEGLAYFRQLAQMQPQIRHGHTFMAELVASGALPLSITMYDYSVERLRKKGAPIAWKPLPPTFGRPAGISVARRAPHPHAALLFADFMLSREGQELLRKRDITPASRAVENPVTFDYQTIDPAIVLDESEKWEPIWAELFLKKAP